MRLDFLNNKVYFLDISFLLYWIVHSSFVSLIIIEPLEPLVITIIFEKFKKFADIKDEVSFIVLLNSDKDNAFTVRLPNGIWNSIVNEGQINSVEIFRNYITVEPLSCTLLKNR